MMFFLFPFPCAFRVTALLDEAERKTKRSVHAATLYKDEIARLTPTKNLKKKSSTEELLGQHSDAMEKDAEIERMRNEIAALQTSMSKDKSKACVVS
jgi:hypothetical protein